MQLNYKLSITVETPAAFHEVQSKSELMLNRRFKSQGRIQNIPETIQMTITHMVARSPLGNSTKSFL